MKTILIAAISVDGFIGRDAHHLANWTSKEDKKVFMELTKRIGVIVMGRNTYLTIGRPLPGRRNIIYSSLPIDNSDIETTEEDPSDMLARLEAEGYTEVAICGGQTVYDMFLSHKLVDELYLTVEPKLFGSGLSLAKASSDVNLKLLKLTKLNDDTLLLQYEVQK